MVLSTSRQVGLRKPSRSFTEMQGGRGGGDDFPKPKDCLPACAIACLPFLLSRSD